MFFEHNSRVTALFDVFRKSSIVTSSSSSAQNVLILGSGYVSAPVVDYLTRDRDVSVTVASHVRGEIETLASTYVNTTPVLLDVIRSKDDVEKLIAQSDLVISLLPYVYHPQVAESCIKHKTNMVTASYRSPEILAMNDA